MINLGYPTAVAPGVPPQLAQFITSSQWDGMRGRFKQIESDATCKACAIEWGVCICFGLCCIFCGHECIKDSMMKDDLNRYVRDMNQQYFKGNSIFYLNGDLHVCIADDQLAQVAAQGTAQPVVMVAGQPQYVVQQQPGQPQYVVQQPVAISPMIAAAAPVEQEPPPIPQVAVAGGGNSAQLTVDDTIKPGSTVTVTAPSGAPVTLTIPQDAVPGSVITYSY